MKMRSGFVSNSSSSSFVALVPKKEWEDLIANEHPAVLAALDKLTGEQMFCGIECISYEYITGEYGNIYDGDWDQIKKRAKEIAKEKGIKIHEVDDVEDEYEDGDQEYEIVDTVMTGLDELEQKIHNLDDRAFTCNQDW